MLQQQQQTKISGINYINSIFDGQTTKRSKRSQMHNLMSRKVKVKINDLITIPVISSNIRGGASI